VFREKKKKKEISTFRALAETRAAGGGKKKRLCSLLPASNDAGINKNGEKGGGKRKNFNPCG